MSARKWKIGFAVAILFGLLSAGAGLVAGMNWQSFVAVLCVSLVTHLGAYLMKHPVESISFDTNRTARDVAGKAPLMALALCLVFSPGCVLLKNPESANLIAQRAGYRITERVLKKHPEWQPHFETARAELIALQAQPKIDALAIVEILERLPAGALDGDEAVIILDGVYITLIVAGDPALTPDGEAQVRSVLDGLIIGMNRRLGPLV